MSEPDAPSADSSPAPALPDLSSLSSTEYDHWRMTGEGPQTPSPDSTPDAESSPAAADDSAEGTPSPQATASETVKPLKSNNAETRKTELAREIDDLLTKRNDLLRELREGESRRQPVQASDATPAASSPAPELDLTQTVAHPDPRRPLLSDGDFFAKFPDATLTDYTRYVARHEMAGQQVQREIESVKNSRINGFYTQKQAAEQANPQFWESIDPRVKTLVPVDLLPEGQTAGPLNVVAQEVVTSNVAMKLIAHLSAHPAELDRLASLPHAAAIAREIGKLEAKLDTTAPPIKAVSSAPNPPTTLGTKQATGAANDADEALRTGDFERYRAIMNRQEMSSAARS